MSQWMAQGGVFMYPLLLVGVVIVALAVWVGVRLRGTTAPDLVLETGIDATLFWGAWAALLGLLGTLAGIYQAAGAIQGAGEVSAPLIWGGIQVALITTLFGLTIFAVAALLWLALRTSYRRRAAI